MDGYKFAVVILTVISLNALTYIYIKSIEAPPVYVVQAPAPKTPSAESCERMNALLNGGQPADYASRCK